MGFLSDIVGGVTSLFGANEAKERGEDILNATIRGQEAYRGAGKTMEEFLAPYAEQAKPTFERLLGLITGSDYSGFKESPGYQFAQDESARAIGSNAAMRGGIVSGRTLKALQERSQQIANQEFQQYLGNLGNLFSTTYGAGATKAQVPWNIASQTTPLDIYGQGAMGEGNMTATAMRGSGIGQIGEGLMSLFTGGMNFGGTPKITGNWGSSGAPSLSYIPSKPQFMGA